MKDWRAIAQAYGLPLSARDLDRIVAPLDALEEAFRPLVSDLTPDLEPCIEFSAEFSALEDVE
jgi:hypothetical protein